jgi:hypothetical protein
MYAGVLPSHRLGDCAGGARIFLTVIRRSALCAWVPRTSLAQQFPNEYPEHKKRTGVDSVRVVSVF